MTGTSTRTPTTVARAAPLSRPNRLMATATASSKKFEVQDWLFEDTRPLEGEKQDNSRQ